MTAIQAVLFDFGGVLAEEGFSSGLESLAAQQRLQVPDMTAAGMQAVYDSGFVLGRSTEAEFWSLLRRRTGLRGDDAILTALILDAFTVRPWILELVDRLRAQGYVTGILSDQTDWLDRLDARYGFYRRFDRVYNSYYLGKGKRDPSLFDDVAADLGLAPACILFVDDNADNVARARGAGMQAIHYVGREPFVQALQASLPGVTVQGGQAVPGADEFRDYLEALGDGLDPAAGFFSPDTVFWRVSREPVLLLAGMRALLLQIAHPGIAQGVADHSRYREDPLGRGIRTFTAVYSLVFGSRDEAIAAALRVRAVHDRVHGEVRDPLPPGMDARYDANDPQLLLWVAATLLDSAVLAYELFVEPLSAAEKEQHYQQARRFGQLFGLPLHLYPENWVAFRAWWQQMLDSDTLTVTDTARDICRGLLGGTWFTRLLAPFNDALAVMLLPERLAERYGLRRTAAARLTFRLLVGLTRVAVRVLPRRLRGVPAARRGERRAGIRLD